MLCFISFYLPDAGLSLFKLITPIVFQQLPSLISLLSFQNSEFQNGSVSFDCCISNCCGISTFKGYFIHQSSQLFHFLIPPHWYLLFYHAEIHHLAPAATWLSMSLAPLSIPTSVPSTLTTGPSVFPAGHCLSYFTLH